MTMLTGKKCSRRGFLKGAMATGATLAFPMIVPSSVRGANAPSNRINMGCIGVGRMGSDDMRDLMRFNEIRVVAVCDADSNRMANAKKVVEQRYADEMKSGAYKGCETIEDYRTVCGRSDIDAVMICTPDHWHVLPALAAARAGKDIFLQKPMSLTIQEGRIVSDTVRRSGVVFQVGSQQRSDERFRFACELVRNGRIGKVHTVKVGCGIDPGTGVEPEMPVPKNLNYDLWLGPAPWAPYTEKRVHPQVGYDRPGWLRIADYGAGMLTGWGSHHMDIAHWGLGMENSGPLSIQGTAEFPPDGLWNVHGRFHVEYQYPNDVTVIFADEGTGPGQVKSGVEFIGSEGSVWVTRGAMDTNPKSLMRSVIGPDELHLYKSLDHKRNFVECMRSRAETIAPVENGHRSCTACLLADIAIRTGRKLRWDARQERFINDEEANRWLTRSMRAPWTM